MSRATASRIVQLRLSHIPLNGYLKRIHKVNSTRCPACGVDKENIKHFLLRCPNYVYERWTLTQHTRKKHKALSLKVLLEDPQFILPLAAYIQETENEHTVFKYRQKPGY